jgi:hypothetical protein
VPRYDANFGIGTLAVMDARSDKPGLIVAPLTPFTANLEVD